MPSWARPTAERPDGLGQLLPAHVQEPGVGQRGASRKTAPIRPEIAAAAWRSRDLYVATRPQYRGCRAQPWHSPSYGARSGGACGSIAGMGIAIGVALIVFPSVLGAAVLIRFLTGKELDELAPIIAILIMGAATLSVAVNGLGSKGGNCAGSGRYSEHSSCLYTGQPPSASARR